MEGWVKLHRRILENDIWYDVTTFRLFTLLLLKASHQNGVKINGIEVKKGQYIRSYSKLAEDLAYTKGRGTTQFDRSTIKRSVDKLVEKNMITVKETKFGTLFTIVNYSKYQDSDRESVQGVKEELPLSDESDTSSFNQIENKFIQYRQRGLDLTMSDVQAIQRVLDKKVSTEKILRLMDQIHAKYQEKYPSQNIGSFSYYEKAINSSLEREKQTAKVTVLPKRQKESSIDALAKYAEKRGIEIGGSSNART